MRIRKRGGAVASVVAIGCVAMTGCRQESTGTPRPPASTTTTTERPPTSQAGNPHAGNPHAGMAAAHADVSTPAPMAEVDISGIEFMDETLTLDGLECSIPVGWQRETPGSGMRKAQFRLAKADNEPEDVEVVITHFPNMKGMDESNLRRWYEQFTQPDGRPTVEAARQAVYQLNRVAVTLVDIPGTMSTGTMMSGGETKENYRMLAAIIDHAQGPHFLKLTGPAGGVDRWKASGVAFLKSIRVKK